MLPRNPRQRVTVLALGILSLCGCCASSGGQLRARTTPGADADVLLWHDRFELTADGARQRLVHQKTTLHTEVAVDDLGDPRVVHDTTHDQLEVVRAVTTMRDGKQVAIKPNSINESTPSALAKAPAYADLRETVITLVGLELGSTTDLEYRISTAASKRPLSAAVPVRGQFPVAERRITVQVPTGKELLWACLACEAKAEKSEKAGGSEYVFSWASLPGLNLEEADGEPFNEPRLVFTTATSWRALADDLAAAFAAAAKAEGSVEARAEALSERLVTGDQKLRAAWRFVAEDLATVDWSLADFHLQPRAAAAVLESSFGHSLDKAVLLASLLAEMGLPAKPLFISRDGLFAAPVPADAQFAEVWLSVDVEGTERWVDPTAVRDGNGRALLEGRWALDLETAEPARVELGSKALEQNQSVVVAEVTLTEPAALRAELSVSLSGSYSPFSKVKPSWAGGQVAKAILGKLGGGSWKTDCDDCSAELLHLDPELAAFTYEVEGEAAGEGRAVEVTLPWAPGTQLAALDLHRATRETATTLDSRGLESAKVTLQVPKTLELRSKLPSGRVENSVGSLNTTSRREGNAIIIERTLRLNQRIISPADYPALRALFAELTRRDHRALLFYRPHGES